jgi:hypothetical protein
MTRSPSLAVAPSLTLLALSSAAAAQRRPVLNEYGNPTRLAPAPTTSAITPRDL